MSEYTCEHVHGRCFPGAVIAQQNRDLSLVHIQTEILHSNEMFASSSEYLEAIVKHTILLLLLSL